MNTSSTYTQHPSRLIESARIHSLRWFNQRQIPYIIVSLIGVMLLYILMVGTAVVAASFFIDIEEILLNLGSLPPWQTTIGLVVNFLPFFIAVWLWVRFFEGRAFMTNGLLSDNAVAEYIRGVVSGFVMLTAVVVILGLMGTVTIENPFNTMAIGGALLVTIGWVVQGAAEEFFTRGFIMQIVGRRFGIIAGVVVSALIFTLLHTGNLNVSLLGLVNLALVSIFLSIYSLKEGALWGVFGWHSVWNWAQGNLFGFEVSGNDLAQNSIVLDLAENGADWITGGPFGLEGGVITSTVLVFGIGWLLIAGRLKPWEMLR